MAVQQPFHRFIPNIANLLSMIELRGMDGSTAFPWIDP